MPKKKKTRKQKQLADERRQTETAVTHTATSSVQKPIREEHKTAPEPQFSSPQKPTALRSIATTDYHYLSYDLRKTLILTGVIIVAEIVIKQVTGI